ncbi:MAG: PP2C family protein-serine/threonine phosphatase, partial [Saprospiraceae bacterium]
LSNFELLERELTLKQLQINRLLNITQAINDNVSEEGLFNMYNSFLSWEMGIKKMALYIKGEDEEWRCPTHAGISKELLDMDIQEKLKTHTRLHNLGEEDEHPFINEFDVVVPVRHKDEAIAYTFIGGFDKDEDMYDKVSFITTITNIIVVAIENKRLFNKKIEQEAIKREMELAGAMQQMLIPQSLPKNDRYELASIYQPHSTIGGDYFDFIDYDDPRFAFCVADVSGKGAAAALLMSNIQATVRYLINKRITAEPFIRELNQRILESAKGEKFITFFIAEFNTETGELIYVNGGHNNPILIENGKLQLLNKGCTILGAFDDVGKIEVGKIVVKEDALVVVYTDGLTDIQNKEGVYFDEDKLADFCMENKNLSAEEFNQTLTKRMEAFKGDEPYPDDVSVLTCRIKQGGVFISKNAPSV